MITCSFENGDSVGLRHAVVGVIINRNKKTLLSRRGTFKGRPILESGKWDIVGGFVDRGETLVEAVRRETLEESGWELSNIHLFRINDNPHRPNDKDRQNLSIIFIADAVIQHRSSTEEVTELKWFELGELPPKTEIAFDHGDDLELYKKYLKEKFTLPVLG